MLRGTICSVIRIRVGHLVIETRGSFDPIAFLAHNFLLTSIGSVTLTRVTTPYFLMHDLEQKTHVGETGRNNTDGRLNARPHARVHLSVFEE
jgi:hypothetical protein